MRIPGFADLAISRKLILLFTLASGLALLVFAGTLWVYQSTAYRRALNHEMATLAETLADSNAAAVAFHDTRSADDTLSLLRAEQRVAAACLYPADAPLVASYVRVGSNTPCPAAAGQDRVEFSNTMLTVVRTARLRGANVGQLLLLVELNDLSAQLRRLGYICAGVLGCSLLVAIVVASRLQRLISGPVLDLAAVASRVSTHRDYSIRAKKTSTDELGVLIENFNEMMAQIHQRDIALERAQAELEERVRDRTTELRAEIATRRLVEQDLMNAKEVAEESNRAKSAFLANMSHELRTPLNAILGYGELLEEDAEADGNASALADLRCIKTAGQHLLHLINDILDLSKIEAGRMDMHPEPTMASSLIADVSSTIQPLAAKNHNDFVINEPTDDYIVDVDSVRFRQSLLNLLSNACKFTEEGTISLSVDREQTDTGNWVCFAVSDTGPGIAWEHRNKLFRPFSQVDSSATRKHGGTGLGLSISQRFCQMMGGQITVDSEPGKGSTFTIRMPESQRSSESEQEVVKRS
jgi:signal transduction histidine kinase